MNERAKVFAAPEEREEFFRLAARVFNVPREKLSGDLPRGGIQEWDSVNHFRLVMEAEELFGIRYDIAEIPILGKMEDFFMDKTALDSRR